MIPFPQVETPAFVLEEEKLVRNLELIQSVQQRAGVSVILALKGFALWRVFPLLKQYLAGATASSLHEARLIHEEMGLKAHTYAVAYRPQEIRQIAERSSHLTFNSLGQCARYKEMLEKDFPNVSLGLRVNPEYSEVSTDLYNPAAPGSRLGEPISNLINGWPDGVEGIHFHTLCESSAKELERTWRAFEKQFGAFLPELKWLNLGGGHLMTRKDYDVDHLVQILLGIKHKYPYLSLILEPGSAIAWETGDLHTSVLDIHEARGIKTLILDTSFTCHMPDTLEMPYRPGVIGAHKEETPGTFPYRLGGVSCLAGDFQEVYYFAKQPQIGDRIILQDMMHYTLVKTTMFNGVHHPSICYARTDGQMETLRTFAYEDYRNRMA